MLKFWKETSVNLKSVKPPVTSATLQFQELFELNVTKNIFLKGFVTKKQEEGHKSPFFLHPAK